MHQTHLSLHHVWSVETQVEDNAIYVRCVSCVELLQYSIQDDEGSSSADTSTKINSADSVTVRMVKT